MRRRQGNAGACYTRLDRHKNMPALCGQVNDAHRAAIHTATHSEVPSETLPKENIVIEHKCHEQDNIKGVQVCPYMGVLSISI